MSRLSRALSFKKINNRVGGVVIPVLIISLIGGYSGAWLQNKDNNTQLIGGNLSQQKKVVTSESRLISQIAKTVGQSVVSVNVAITDSSTPESDFFGFSQPSQARAAGTGIIISDKGLVITNRHVVPKGTTEVSITLSDGTELKDVSVVGRTNDNDTLDVAFLKISDTKGHKLQAASIGNSADIQVGDDVVAIGNALGQFQNTVTSGIVSGFGRSVVAGGNSATGSTESLDNLIQTDAAINEGNSGGPLVNLNGQVIGINTAIAGGGAQNIGFAIPINDVSGLISYVLDTGKFARPYLGVHYVSLTADSAKEYNLKVSNGAYIAPNPDGTNPSVVAGSPADKAGLHEKDVITAVNDKKVDQTHSLSSVLGTHKPGDKVKLTVYRDGKTINISATLGTLPTAE